MCSLIFFNEKKNQKDSDDFWHRKFTLKVKFWYFLTALHYSNFQNLVISFEYSWFLAKNLSNFVSLPWKLHNRECHTQQSWYLTCHCLICTRLKSDTFEIYKKLYSCHLYQVFCSYCDLKIQITNKFSKMKAESCSICDQRNQMTT